MTAEGDRLLPGRGLVAVATVNRLRALADQLEDLEGSGLLRWEHMDALLDQLEELRRSVMQGKNMFAWADFLSDDGKNKSLAEIAAAREDGL